MVYRILPKPRSAARHFFSHFARVFLGAMLISLGFNLFMGIEGTSYLWIALWVSILAAALFAWLSVRAFRRLDWFTPTPSPYFLTLVEEGLVLESLAKGFSLYMPWKDLTFRRYRDILYLFYCGAYRAALSLHGLPAERREAMLADLRHHAGKQEATHGLFAPDKAAAPFAVAAGDTPPPLPTATLPPPVPLEAATEVPYSNTEQQWTECLHLSARPGKLACGLLMACVAVSGYMAAQDIVQEGELLAAWFPLAVGAYCLYRLARPGRTRTPRVPGRIRLDVTRREFYERTEQGAWGRYRLPAVSDARLITLPHGRVLLKHNGLPSLLHDAVADLPPALAAYPSAPAPSNRLRALAAALLMGLGMLAGWGCGAGASAAAFRELLPEPDEAALHEFVATHYAYGVMQGEPVMFAEEPDEEGEEGYTITFITTAADPAYDDGEKHPAWQHILRFSPSGYLREKYGYPVDEEGKQGE